MISSHRQRICTIFLSALFFFAGAGSLFASTFKDLQASVDATAAGGTLTLSQNYGFAIATDSPDMTPKGIVISKAITIDGGGMTIDANGISRVFTLQKVSGDKKITLKNMTITKGGSSASTSGGGLYIDQYVNVSMDACVISCCGTVKGDHTTTGGAAMFVGSRANLTMDGCGIVNNTGKDRAGGLYLKGNAVLTGCTVSNNTSSSRGGGIYVDPGSFGYNKRGDVYVKDGVSYDLYNSKTRGGDWGGNIRMYNCTVTGNTGGRGGAIYVNTENDKLNVFENCTVTNNTAATKNLGYGGGMLFYNAKAQVTNCYIANNTAAYGGGVIIDVYSPVELTDTIITGNKAEVAGGGLYAFDGSHDDNVMKILKTATYTGCTIKNNTSPAGADDISMHYTDEATAAARLEYASNDAAYKDGMSYVAFLIDGTYTVEPDPSEYRVWTKELWKARWDGLFTSGGKNLVGTVLDASCDKIAMASTDIWTTSKKDSPVPAPAPDGGSSSGCNAGFASLLLLAALPFTFKNHK